MYLAYLINLRGEKKREKRKKKEKEREEKKERGRRRREEEGEKKKRKEEYSWPRRCWQVERRAARVTTGRMSRQRWQIIPHSFTRLVTGMLSIPVPTRVNEGASGRSILVSAAPGHSTALSVLAGGIAANAS